MQESVCDDILTRGSSPVPEPSHPRIVVRAAPRIQWRDRAGLTPASRANVLAELRKGRRGPSCVLRGGAYDRLVLARVRRGGAARRLRRAFGGRSLFRARFGHAADHARPLVCRRRVCRRRGPLLVAVSSYTDDAAGEVASARGRRQQRRRRGDRRAPPDRRRRHSGAGALDRAAAPCRNSRRAARRRFVRLDLRQLAPHRRAHRTHARSGTTIARLRRATARLHAANGFVRAPSQRFHRARQRSDLDGRRRVVHFYADRPGRRNATRRAICTWRTAFIAPRRSCGASPTCSSPTRRCI